MRKAVRCGLTPHQDRMHTITYDNDREFADHDEMAAELETPLYLAHPYASWEGPDQHHRT
jgi:IS30 family transposase